MSLLGLIRHMADVERNWFRRAMAQAGAPPLYWSENVPDGHWLNAVADPAVVDDAWRAWRDEVAFAEKLAADSPDLGIKGINRDSTSVAALGTGPHDRGVCLPLQPRRPAPGTGRRPRRAVTAAAAIRRGRGGYRRQRLDASP